MSDEIEYRMDAVGVCCGHEYGDHKNGPGPCSECGCGKWLGGGDRIDQCQAYTGTRTVRCVLDRRHVDHGVDHKGPGRSRVAFRWTEGDAAYPLSDPTLSAESSIGLRDAQVGGNHYASHKVQVWDIVDDWNLDYYRGHVVKYTIRAGSKGPALEDLKKAMHCLQKAIEVEEARVAGETG